MYSTLKLDPTKLRVFHEGRKRRVFVGDLVYVKENNNYEFIYNKKYTQSKNAIPVGPGLDLFKLRHESEKGKLFPSFIDRLPDKDNPAYNDYCKAQGIYPDEENLIILLGTIGKRGPSSFVYEQVYCDVFAVSEITQLRKQLNITQNDLAKAFDINRVTLLRIESGASHDISTLRLIQMLLEFPEVALWQLKQTGGRIHRDALTKLINYFESNLRRME